MNPNYVTIVKQDLDKLLNMWVSLPQWRKQVRYRPSFWSEKEWPAPNLCGRPQAFEWTTKCQRAWEIIKQHCTDAPILILPDWDQHF
jgi:hypothetical protein